MSTQQTDALQCAADLEYSIARHGMQDAFTLNAYRAMKMVRTQHARITELESQLAQRFDAADMATTAAQGFRDGVASLSANAGEPRNAIDRDALIDAIAQGLHGTWHCTRVWEAWHVGTMSQDDFEPVDESETPTEIADAVLSILASHGQAPAGAADSVQEDAARLLALEAAANQIFNNPPSETSQDVRDVIEWFSGSIRVVLDAARKQGASQ